jgi:hypothetical protein
MKLKKILIVLSVLALALSACSSLLAAQAQTPETPLAGASVESEDVPSMDPAGSTETPAADEPETEAVSQISPEDLSYPIVDTGQTTCYSDQDEIACPLEEDPFYGQDAQYEGNSPAYADNGDGTVTDLNTGLMWAASPDLNGDGQIDSEDKLDYHQAAAYAESFDLAGYDDWRLPTIKELYSLIDFNGITGVEPYIDTVYFEFAFGDTVAGERDIDAQFATSTLYVSTTMNGQQTMFGVNLADGRIKGYPTSKMFYVYFVRGDTGYGENDFVDNGDGTISDLATGLTWLQQDSGALGVGNNGDGTMNWEEALTWCESLDYAGYDDWRLPDAKELQSIVDYSRSPDTTGSAAIDPLFQATLLSDGVNNSGEANYGHYWSSTTHLDGRNLGARAAYVAFGEARGFMDFGQGLQLYDVHGAGAQRSDLKSGDPSQFELGMGPQGDVQSTENMVRCVRSGTSINAEGSSTAGTMPETTTNAGMETTSGMGTTSGQSETPPEGPTEADLEVAAEVLGVSLDELKAALGDPSQGPPDLAAAAQQLGVGEEALINALGIEPPPQKP